MAKQYTEDDLGILVAGDWSLLNSEGAEVMHGAGVRATQRQKPGPWKYPREMVLTFPFSLNQFRDFCDWHTYFQWEVIEAQYLNDDGSLDEDALGELAQRGEDAAELVRRYLTGETDAEKAAGPPPTVDRAEAREAPPTGQQDAPERSSSEEDSGESRAGEVHPDALAKAIATEVVQQLRNPIGAVSQPSSVAPRDVLMPVAEERQGAPKMDQRDAPYQSAQDRQAHRWQLCIDAGLKMPQDTYASYPRGIRAVADRLRITRQALAQDLNAHRERLFGK